MRSQLRTGRVLLLSMVLVLGAFSCAQTQQQVAEAEPEVGQPPADDESDRQPAPPPEGPEVDMSDGGEAETEPAGPAPTDAPVVTAEQVESFMSRGPSYALTVSRVEPHRVDGSFAGFEIVALHPSAKRFVDPELAIGDVITHINGVRVKKPDDYLAAWKLLDDVDAISIEFLRDGTEKEAVWRVEASGESASNSGEPQE